MRKDSDHHTVRGFMRFKCTFNCEENPVPVFNNMEVIEFFKESPVK